MNAGLQDKYRVERHDGRDAPGHKHAQCFMFVLDVTHDPAATAALSAYCDAAVTQRPQLVLDLYQSMGWSEHSPTYRLALSQISPRCDAACSSAEPVLPN